MMRTNRVGSAQGQRTILAAMVAPKSQIDQIDQLAAR
jgi:hypothetical protein